MSDSPWNQPGTVEGFVRSPPNSALLQGRGARIPPVRETARHIGRDESVPITSQPAVASGIAFRPAPHPMLSAAAARVVDVQLAARVRLLLAPMHQLPLAADSFDFIVLQNGRQPCKTNTDRRPPQSERGVGSTSGLWQPAAR
jgi:hypothetical protein